MKNELKFLSGLRNSQVQEHCFSDASVHHYLAHNASFVDPSVDFDSQSLNATLTWLSPRTRTGLIGYYIGINHTFGVLWHPDVSNNSMRNVFFEDLKRNIEAWATKILSGEKRAALLKKSSLSSSFRWLRCFGNISMICCRYQNFLMWIFWPCDRQARRHMNHGTMKHHERKALSD